VCKRVGNGTTAEIESLTNENIVVGHGKKNRYDDGGWYRVVKEQTHHSLNRVLNSIGMSTAKRKSVEKAMEGIKSGRIREYIAMDG